VLKFEGAALLTHNATSLILPGGANIIAADGDVGIFMSEGSGNWRCLSYIPAAAAPIPATQTEMEAGSSTARFVPPGRQHNHPSAAKGWVMGDTAGNAAASYNVTSITDNGAGNWTINWATDFSGTSYCSVATIQGDPAGNTTSTFVPQIGNSTFAAGATQVHSLRVSDGAGTDPNNFFCAVFGDQ
jgi:hypothetical protein